MGPGRLKYHLRKAKGLATFICTAKQTQEACAFHHSLFLGQDPLSDTYPKDITSPETIASVAHFLRLAEQEDSKLYKEETEN